MLSWFFLEVLGFFCANAMSLGITILADDAFEADVIACIPAECTLITSSHGAFLPVLILNNLAGL